MRTRSLMALCAALFMAPQVWGQAPIVDPALPTYRPMEIAKGKIQLIGSDTMAQVAAIWGDGFRRYHQDAQVDIEVLGSVNAVSSVIEGKATFGLLSRAVTEEEAIAFQKKFGYPMTVLTPSLESIAIFVHAENPIESLTLSQLDGIFSKSLHRGAPQTARTWSDVGIGGNWAKAPIVCRTRSATTGSQVFMRNTVLGGGEFRDDVISENNNLALVKAVAGDPRSIGFAGAIYQIPGVKPVAISWKEGEPALTVDTPGYPLVRPLQLVVNHKPGTELPTLQREFLKYLFSQQGQEAVVVGGFQPISARPAQIALDAVGLTTFN